MQHWFWNFFGWPLVLSGLVFIIYKVWVGPYMTAAGKILGKPQALASTSGWTWFLTWISGWKTHILAAVSGVSGILSLAPQFISPDLIREWQELPWASAVDAKTASAISLICAFLIPITHSIGIYNAAKTPPQV